ncbi:hypothetical protein SBRCBS47491_005852 [Sporothrix bragantina]|uniref:Glc8 protein n=1 Tax=Sporothrix bragantina TaxID=671064 RepID=A0ABP0C0J6_9PEZI
MADVSDAPAEKPRHSPPPPDAKRPKGILKRSFQHSPPTSPPPSSSTAALPSTEAPDGHVLTDKERTILNTQVNAGHRRSSSAAAAGRPSRRSRTPSTVHDHDVGDGQRLKWDEVNLYLTEQDRTATMKIDEPKTPYAQHYDPAEDPSDDEDLGGGLSLGEPEEAVPVNEFDPPRPRSTPKVHVDDNEEQGSVYEGSSVRDGDDPMAGMSPEEREKHLKFEAMRKKHYEMRNVARLLGHSEEIEDAEGDGDDDDEDEEEGGPAVPPLPKTS